MSTSNADLAASAAGAVANDSRATGELPAPVEAFPAAGVVDPRVRRTREMLQQALSRLLKSRDFEKLSVQEITEAAGLNRATFYAHYPDKSALLECLVAGHLQALLESRGVVFDGACAGALQGIALGVCDYLAEVLSPSPSAPPSEQSSRSQDGADADRAQRLAPHLESTIAAVVRRMLLDGLKRNGGASGDSPEMLAATASWAIYGAAREWVSTSHRMPAEAMAQRIVRLVAPLLGMPVETEPV